MSPTTIFLAALLLGALVSADSLLQTEAMARRARAAGDASKRLWAAHFAQLALLTTAFLFFAWTRLHFATASVPSFLEFLTLAAVATLAHIAIDLGVRPSSLGDPLKVLALALSALLLQSRHPEWSLLTQGPVIFLGSPVALESMARYITLLFGLSWAGLVFRQRRLFAVRLLLVLLLVLASL